MIEDAELCSLFRAESEEHLQKLEAGLLRLEVTPRDADLLNEAFREAHSLKGSARMLGVSSVEKVAHRFEDMLGEARAQKAVFSPVVFNRFYGHLDALKSLVREAVTGEPSGVDVPALVALLAGAAEETTAPPAAAQAEAVLPDAVQAEAQAEAVLPDAVQAAAPPAEASYQPDTQKYHIETIRVDPGKLDNLMRLAGELTVAKLRIVRRLSEEEEMLAFGEEWHRAAASSRLTRRAGSALSDGDEREFDRLAQLGARLKQLRQGAYEDNAGLEAVTARLEEDIRVMRLLPLSTIFNLFPRVVRDLAQEQAKEVRLVVEGGETLADKRILEEMKDPLMHMIRNAVDHGIEAPDGRERNGKPRAGTVYLRARQTAANIVIEVEDDGQGLDLAVVKRTALKRRIAREDELNAMTPAQVMGLIFVSGFSTSEMITDVSGRGVGLDVVRATVEALKGTVNVSSLPGVGCAIQIDLPVTLATTRVLICAVDGRPYALPVEYVQTIRRVSPGEVFSIEGRQTVALDGRPVSVVRLSDLLEVRNGAAGAAGQHGDEAAGTSVPCVFFSLGEDRLGLLVDALLDEQEVVVKPHGHLLKRVRNVSGSTILGTGEVCIVLSPHDLMRSVRKRSAPAPVADEGVEAEARRQVVLLVEDSITTRTQEKRILEGAGYEVVTAVDGLDAFNKLSAQRFDAVVSDIEMPNMDGLALTSKIRGDRRYAELPVILVTALATDEDRKRGMEVGANGYITKSTFDQKLLLDTLRRLV